MSKLQDVQNELQAKRERVAQLFAKGYESFTTADVEQAQQWNAELNDLGKKYDELKQLDTFDQQVKAAIAADEAAVKGNRLAVAQAPEREAEQKSVGEMFTESPSFKNWQPNPRVGRAETTIEGKTLVTLTVYTPQVVREPGIRIGPANRLEHVADFVPNGTVGGPSLAYMTETTAANTTAATTVAEGGTKPEAAFTWAEVTVPVRKIAVNIPMTDEAMQDVPFLQSYINNRLVESLKLTEDVQLISGSGVAPNLTGFLVQSGLQTQALGADPPFDAIFKAMTKVRVTGRSTPTATMIHPTNWQTIALTRTADGLYILGNPQSDTPERLWGVPVLVTDAITLGTALTGDFRAHSMILRRTGVTIATSSEHSTFFVENKIMLQAEERLLLLVDRGAAFCQVTGLL